MVAALVSAFAVVGLALVLSQRLQLVLGYSPLAAALVLLPASVMAFVGGPLAGRLSPRFGADRVIAASLMLGGLGVAGLFATANAGLLPQLVCLAAYGLGAGAAMAAASHAIMSHASAEHAGMAASIEEVGIELAARSASPCWAASWPASTRRSSCCPAKRPCPPNQRAR